MDKFKPSTAKIRTNLQILCLLIVAVFALGLFHHTLAQSPQTAQTPPRIVEGVTFESGLSRAVSRKLQNVMKGNDGARGAKSEVDLQLYFTNPKLPEWANTCGAGEFVHRRVNRTKRVAEAALKLLFAGPTAEEKAKGMESLSPLGAYYRGVSIKDGTAVVNFRPGAEKYLYVSGPACQQERVLTPIVKTLKQFSTIKSVDFAINGKIIEEWDA